MADEYVSRVSLEVNGQVIDDFDSVEEGELEYRKTVNLMNKTGSCDVKLRPTVSVDYVIPMDKEEFNFAGVSDATLVIDRGNGTRITYNGVATAKVGKTKYDGNEAAKKTIDFIATERSEG